MLSLLWPLNVKNSDYMKILEEASATRRTRNGETEALTNRGRLGFTIGKAADIRKSLFLTPTHPPRDRSGKEAAADWIGYGSPMLGFPSL